MSITTSLFLNYIKFFMKKKQTTKKQKQQQNIVADANSGSDLYDQNKENDNQQTKSQRFIVKIVKCLISSFP